MNLILWFIFDVLWYLRIEDQWQIILVLYFHQASLKSINLMFALFHCFRVLKPPGGGSSDIFGAAPEETSPRRVKNHNQSQLGSALFGDAPNSNSNETPRNKPGNDSYNRLFGPPDAPPTTPNAKNHMRSNISLSGESTSSSVSSGAATSPAKSTGSTDSIAGVLNGYAASNGNNLTNDITGKV